MQFRHVLFIGPDNRNHRGGIGAVLETYSKAVGNINFLATNRRKTFIYNFFFYALSLIKLVFRLIVDKEVEILHLHSASRGSFVRKSLIVLFGKLFGRKIVFHLHGGEFHIFFDKWCFLRPYIRFILTVSDSVICLAPNWKQFIEKIAPNSKVVIINNPIEEKPFSNSRKCPNTTVSFLFLGRLVKSKGIFDLLHAISKTELKEQIHLYVGGDGDIDKFMALINELSLTNYVTYCGWASGKLKQQLLNDADVFVLPSYNEGLPMSILEAMVNGLPVISTPVGGIPEIVKNEQNGLLINPGNIDELADGITWMVKNSEGRTRMGEESRNLVSDFDVQKVLDKLRHLYSAI